MEDHEIFNSRISNHETYVNLKSLKNHKGVGPDNICNELLKYGKNFLSGPITNLFNLIFNAGECLLNCMNHSLYPFIRKAQLQIQIIIEE
jgi:hypothetical protein